MKSNKYISGSIYFIVFIFGFFGGKILSVPIITFDPSIRLSNLIQSLTTLSIAVFITLYFDKKKEIDKTLKKIIVDRVSVIEDDLLDLYSVCDIEKNVTLVKTHSQMKSIRSNISSLFEVCKSKGISIVNETEFTTLLRELNELYTMVPACQSVNPPIKVENEKYVYSADRIDQIQCKIERIQKAIFVFQINILEK